MAGANLPPGHFVELGIHGKDLQYFAQNHDAKLITSKKQDHEAQGLWDARSARWPWWLRARAYSVASSPHDEFSEFFRSSFLGNLPVRLIISRVGDGLCSIPRIWLFDLARYQLPRPMICGLLATGTGLAPFVIDFKDHWCMAAISAHYFGEQRTHLARAGLSMRRLSSIKVNLMATMERRLYSAYCQREADYAGEKRGFLTILSGKLTELVGQNWIRAWSRDAVW